MLSTGMSEMWQIQAAVDVAGHDDLMIAHATSAYPCPPEESEPADDTDAKGNLS